MSWYLQASEMNQFREHIIGETGESITCKAAVK